MADGEQSQHGSRLEMWFEPALVLTKLLDLQREYGSNENQGSVETNATEIDTEKL